MDALSFLRPLLLAGLAALAVPIIIHLLGRRRLKVVSITTLQYLRQAQARAAARWRLRRLLLLLSRMLLLGCLAMLFAGPGCLKPTRLSSEPMHWVLILDGSASMLSKRGDRNPFADARKALTDIVLSAREGDRFLVTTTDMKRPEGWDAGFLSDKASALAAIERAKVGFGPHGLIESIERGRGILKDLTSGRIVLATDLQESSWKGRLSTEGPVAPIHILDHGIPDPVNTWITSVEETPAGLRVAVKSGTGSRATSVRMESPPGRFQSAAVKHGIAEFPTPESTSDDLLKLSLVDGGDLPADDTFELDRSHRDRIRLLVVNGEPSGFVIRNETFFLRQALESGRKLASRIQYEEISSAELPTRLKSGVDVLFLANVGGIPPESAAMVRSSVQEGLGVILTAGGNWADLVSRIRPPSDQGRALGLLFPAPLRDRVVIPSDDPRRPPFEKIDSTGLKGPFSVFTSGDDGDFGSARIRTYWIFEALADPALRVLLRLENTAPLLIEKSQGKGRTLVLATSIDRDDADLCLQPSFLPFADRLIRHAAGRLGPDLPPVWMAGKEITLPFERAVTVEDPGKTRTRVEPGSVYLPSEPGLFRIIEDDRRTASFFAQTDPEESSPGRVSKEVLDAALGPGRYSLSTAGDDFLSSEVRGREDYSTLVSVLLVLALAAEALLAARWRSTKPQPLFERPE